MQEHSTHLISALDRLWIQPIDLSLYHTACIHRSFLNEADKSIKTHNERLEFLWDAALELAMTDLIYRRYPDRDEGWMTDLRSTYVRGTHLAEIALHYWLDNALLMSLGEKNAGGARNPNILADMLEAIFGALYLDQGYEAVYAVIRETVFASDKIREQVKDPKSLLQELVQKFLMVTPTYDILDETGRDHEKIFTIAVSVQSVIIGTGVWTNKKKAQETAAQNALDQKDNWEYLLTKT